MNSIKKQLSILCTLLFLILLSFLYYNSLSKNNTIQGTDILQIQYPLLLTKIEIRKERDTIILSQKESSWTINNTFIADESFISILLQTLHLNRVKQEVSQKINTQELFANTIKVILKNQEQTISSFFITGNKTKTETYLQLENTSKIYKIEIPGYNSYVAGIFELTENQWRNRIIFQSDARTLISLKVVNLLDSIHNVSLSFKKDHIEVANIKEIDSIALSNYLSHFNQFYTNEYISAGQKNEYDSIMKTQALYSISIQDIDSNKNTIIHVFSPLHNNTYHILKDDKGYYSLCESKRIKQILVNNSYFSKKKGL
ncbi:MAG: hypothetical protein QM536_04010 [Chitinophagaceae bacterium]|nr:hypothetical protein [Chitinophagaceae bacterium]